VIVRRVPSESAVASMNGSVRSSIISTIKGQVLDTLRPDIDIADIGKGMSSGFAFTSARMFGRGW
jgi:hypothetical protein